MYFIGECDILEIGDNMLPKDILNKYYHFAVIGVTHDQDKFGYKIYKRLLNRGYQVFGISPKYKQIEGIPVYSSLEDIPHPIDVVVFVVKKEYAYNYIDEMTSLGIHYAWMQPHTYDEDLLKYMTDLGIQPITACILVETS